MRGPYLLRREAMAYFRTAVPAMAATARAQWDDFEFVNPTAYEEYEPLGLSKGEGPLLSMAVSRSGNFVLNDWDNVAGEQYRVEYTVRLFLHCFTPNAEEDVPENARFITMRQRDDISTIVRACILDGLTLGNKDLFDVNPTTLTEEFSDGVPAPGTAGKWFAATAFTFRVKVDESQYRERVATVPEEGVDVQVALLPKEEEV